MRLLTVAISMCGLILSIVTADRSLAATDEVLVNLKGARHRLETAQKGISAIREILSSPIHPSIGDLLYINVQREIVIISLQALTAELGYDPQARRSINEILKRVYAVPRYDRWDVSSSRLGMFGTRQLVALSHVPDLPQVERRPVRGWARLSVDVALLKVEAEANGLSRIHSELNQEVNELRVKAMALSNVLQGAFREELEELLHAIDKVPRVNSNEGDLSAQQERQLEAIKAIPNRSPSSVNFCESKTMSQSY